MSTFSLKITAANRTFFYGRAEIVVLPSVDGEIAIMAHHEEMTIAIAAGSMKIRTESGEEITAAVSDGMASVANNRVSVIVYSAERPEEIDIRRAREAKERAEEQLRQKQSVQEYHISSAALARAMARLKEAGKYKPIGF